MLGQIRFPPVLRAADAAGLAPFQEELGDDFPNFAEEQQFSLSFGPEVPVQALPARSYRFSSGDGAWSIVVSPNSLTLEAIADRYTSYDAFRERFARVWSVALRHLRPTRRLQQGLRYIDHIERDLSVREWTEWIRPELVGFVGDEALSDWVKQALTDIRFELSEGTLAFKHGIVPSGPEAKWGYLLDFDYFEQKEDLDVGVDAVLAKFDAFHDELYAFFRWCVTEKALEEFRYAD